MIRLMASVQQKNTEHPTTGEAAVQADGVGSHRQLAPRIVRGVEDLRTILIHVGITFARSWGVGFPDGDNVEEREQPQRRQDNTK